MARARSAFIAGVIAARPAFRDSIWHLHRSGTTIVRGYFAERAKLFSDNWLATSWPNRRSFVVYFALDSGSV